MQTKNAAAGSRVAQRFRHRVTIIRPMMMWKDGKETTASIDLRQRTTGPPP